MQVAHRPANALHAPDRDLAPAKPGKIVFAKSMTEDVSTALIKQIVSF